MLYETTGMETEKEVKELLKLLSIFLKKKDLIIILKQFLIPKQARE